MHGPQEMLVRFPIRKPEYFFLKSTGTRARQPGELHRHSLICDDQSFGRMSKDFRSDGWEEKKRKRIEKRAKYRTFLFCRHAGGFSPSRILI